MSSQQPPKIAVVGMAVKYAGAKNKDEFWKTLNERTLNTKPITAKRLGTNDKDFHMSKVRSKFADKFNNDRYGTIDGQPKDEHELLLQLARDALKDGGFDKLKSSAANSNSEDGLRRCGIVSGCLSFPRDSLQKEFHSKIYQEHFENYMGDILDPTKIISNDDNNGSSEDKFEMDPASFVASKLDLGGTHYSLDAACASALYVLKVASDHLLSGRCDMMLAGASTFPEPFFILTGFSTFQALPLGGDKSVPLDKDSKGLTPGEGGAIMVLKRYEDAVRDGDKIYGSLLGVGVSNAGAGLPLKPHPPSQISCLQDTYKKIGVNPSTIQYVECHATGTVQGDIAEVEAMKTCFGKSDCPRYGSTKGNFGHTLVSAGFAGMCKVLLSMKNGTIPGTPGIEKPVDDKLVRENTPWPKCELKRAGLSAFGFGGTNAHAVFEEYKGNSSTNIRRNVVGTPTRSTNNNNDGSLSDLSVSIAKTHDKKVNSKLVTVYEITVKRGNAVVSTVEKRFSEFQGLRDHLSQSNGGNSPTRRGRSRFPSAGGLGGFLFGHDPNMIEQRRTELESYLNDSLRDSNALQSGILRTFLNLNSISSSPMISSPGSANSSGVKPLAEVAIVGMEARFGTLNNLAEFERAIFEGKDGACELPEKRWRFLSNDENFLGKIGLEKKPRGCFIDAVDIDFSRIRTPLTKEDQLIPQQLLAISVMDKALQDAGMSKGGNVAVLVGLGTELELYRHRERLSLIEQMNSKVDANKLRDATDYINNAGTSTSYVSFIGNLVATRLSSTWGFTGPSFTITEGENSVLRCIEVGRQMLSTGEVDAVVVAGVDLCGSAESFYVKSKQCKLSKSSSPFAPFEHRADGLFLGEGAGALVLKRLNDCSPSRNKQGEGRIYATIKGVGTGVNTTVSSQMALMEAGIADDAVEYVEVATPSLTPSKSGVEIADLSAVYKGKKSSVRQYAVGCVQANVGYVGYATGVASVIKTALCLYNRYLPVTPRWEKPTTNTVWEKSAFYVCPDSRAWMKNPGERRVAGVNGVSAGGSHFHIVMSDLEGQNERENVMSLPDDSVKLITVVGSSTNDVVNKIMQMQKDFQQSSDGRNYMRTLLQQSLDANPSRQDYVAAIVASYLTLSDELLKAAKGIARANKVGRDWASPAGSFFTPTPIRSDKIAFMYGDGASPYCGLGRDMYRIFPKMHEVVHDKTTEMWSTSDEAWNTREVLQSQMKHAEEKFVHRTVDMFRSGVFHSTIFTAIAREVLGIKPKAAFGLSMGEVATLFAFSNANSSQSDEMTRRLNASPVWTSELAVKFNALRKSWGIGPNVPVTEFWRGYLLHAPRSKVEPIVNTNKYVRMVIINDSRTVIIAGKPDECKKVSEKLGATMNEIPQGMVGHCDFVKPHCGAIQYVHDMLAVPNLKQDGIQLYTGVGGGKPMPQVSGKALGDHVGNIYSEIADFERLVRAVHADGHDVFIELGADSHRSNAVKNILNGKKHVAVSIDRRGESLWNQILKMSAVLISHGVAINLSNLYHSSSGIQVEKRSRLQRKIVLNGRFGSPRPKSPVKSSRNKMSNSSTSMTKKFRKKKKYTGPIVYDEKDLLEFAEGDISKVFGPAFKEIDQYARRVRLPMSEYLLCTRVTHVRGVDMKNYVPCNYKKCSMVTEYDIPINGPHSEGGDVPWAILVESGQCDLMLISMLGVDFECKSERVYRLLDTTLTFYGIAKEGDTLVYDIQVDSFAKRPDGKGLSMFFFRYNCYVNGKLLIEMRNGCAGFFSDEELAAGKGIVYTKAVMDKRAKIKKKSVKPFLIEPARKTSYSQQDMIGLVNCRWGDVVGPTARELNYKLVARKMLMIDQVTHIIPDGGAHGLGLIIGEKFLARDHWYFPCHFKGDQVMAGSLVSDGCSQMLKLYMVWLGLHKTVNNLCFRPVNGQPNKVRCRGQIPPHKGKLIYVMEIREMGFNEETGYPYCVADVDIIDVNHERGQRWDYAELNQYGRGDMTKKIVVDFKGIALQIEGKPTARNPIRGGSAVPRAPATTRRALVPKAASAQLSSSSTFKSTPGRRAPKPIQPPRNSLISDPNPPKALIWHPLAGKNGNPTPYFDPTPYPPRAITFIPFPNNPNDTNHVPGELPLSWVNMCEFMCGRTSACLGPEFSRFDNSKTSRSPAFDLQVVTRVLSVTNLERGSFKFKRYTSDINPSKGTMVAQFDVPEDAWFFKANSSDDLMPYSILMEIGLQTSGILTSWVKAPLTMDKDDILFRNLDATAELLKKVDLRGKTITNTSHVVSYAMLGDMGVHKFTFELSVEGEGVFYKGETSFGWFVPEVFEKQVGLDGGVKRDVWHMVEGKGKTQGLVKYDMTNAVDRRRLRSKAKGESLLRRSLQVEFLDSIQIIPSSGKYGKGYLHGHKDVNKQDWFFSCHFWCDPVMPGSLGIESMYQLIETFCIHSGIGNGMKNRRFEHDLGKVSWKYRGQLTPKNDTMDSEVHIKSILSVGDDIVVIADAALYVDNLRVYTATDLRLKVQDIENLNKKKMSRAARVTAPPSAVTTRQNVSRQSVPVARNTATVQRPRSCGTSLKEALLKVNQPLYINYSNPSEFTHEEPPMELFKEYAEIHSCTPQTMGDPGFMELYGVDYPLYTGAMAKGIASADLVIALGKRKILGSLGAGGLPLHLVNEALDKIQAELPNGPYAVNLIHSPFDVSLERGNVDLFLKRGVTIAEASAFMSLTEHVVRYRVAGLSMKNGKIHKKNKIIAKCSRTELAEMFMRPAPDKFLNKLLKNREITPEQARLAKLVPMSDDIAVESDSGGHTDNRPIHVILPLIMALRDRLQKELKYPTPVRVGVGGGIGCPAAMAAAFQMGAAFIITGSVNQIARQSGSSDIVRKELAKAAYSDVTMAPAADMFDQGVKLQVLKKGTMFASRAHKLWDLFCKYNSLDEIPQKDRERLEKKTFKQSIDAVWKETTNFYINRLHDEEKIKRAHKDPKLKMSLVFRWYLSKSSGWANRGEKDRKLDFQVWCGPAMGAYNDFVKGTYLDPHVTNVYPDAVQINLQLLTGCSFLNRIQQIRSHPKLRNGVLNVDEIATYVPNKEL